MNIMYFSSSTFCSKNIFSAHIMVMGILWPFTINIKVPKILPSHLSEKVNLDNSQQQCPDRVWNHIVLLFFDRSLSRHVVWTKAKTKTKPQCHLSAAMLHSLTPLLTYASLRAFCIALDLLEIRASWEFSVISESDSEYNSIQKG